MTDTRHDAAKPADPMLEFILGLLTPLLAIGDLSAARAAAHHAITAYQAAGTNQLISIAQIVGFALTSLDISAFQCRKTCPRR